MSQSVSDSLAMLSASVLPALEATSDVAAKVSAASSEYVAARHRLDAVLDDAAQIRGQKRAAALEILSKKRSLGANLSESSRAAESVGAPDPVGLSISEVCDGVVQSRTVVKSQAIQQASRLIGYSVSKLDIGGVACMELRFDSSAGGRFSDAKYCVIQWLEERGCCIVKGHNLPFWMMTEDIKRMLVTQGVAAFARAICAMLRSHERRKSSVARLQKCPAVSKVSSTSLMDCIHVVSPAASARVFFDCLSSDGPSRASVVKADGVCDDAFSASLSGQTDWDQRLMQWLLK